MAASLRHRGPDEAGSYVEDGVGLRFRRLSILDLAHGQQPMANEDGSLRLVCNGEIYNHRELAAELRRRGHRLRTASDAEVVLHLYEEHGPSCLEHLRGMFALALWDRRRGRLLLARDRTGQKPLFYARRGPCLFFASEIKALLQADPDLRELEPAALDSYLTLRVVPPPLTFFAGIEKLPPAHYLTFDLRGESKLERYWQLAPEPKLAGRDEELLEALEERLVETLRLHRTSDVPVGAFLSAGIDSTLLVSLLARHRLVDRLRTFTLGVPYRRYDEAPLAREVARNLGADHRESTLSSSLGPALVEVTRFLDEPADPLAICTFEVARLAARSVKVVLGGDGGDELFGGYDRYRGFGYASRYARIPSFVRRRAIGPLVDLLPEGTWYKSPGHQVKWLHRQSFFEAGERYARGLGYFYFDDALRARLYPPQMRAALAGHDPRRPIREAFESADSEDPVDRMRAADRLVRHPDHSLMILDRMSMAHGLEARSPYLDHELVQWVARLPAPCRVRSGRRSLQLALARRHLPPAVLRRKKQGFSSALPYLWSRDLQALCDRVLASSHLARAGYLRQPAIDRLRRQQRDGRYDHVNRLWLLLHAETWYRLGIERQEASLLAEPIAAPASAHDSAPVWSRLLAKRGAE